MAYQDNVRYCRSELGPFKDRFNDILQKMEHVYDSGVALARLINLGGSKLTVGRSQVLRHFICDDTFDADISAL